MQAEKDLITYQNRMRNKAQCSRLNAQGSKGVALIIVIFAMMLFAVLGWTLMAMLSTDFEANLRNLDSEQALGLAEAGAQWALNQLFQVSTFRTTGQLHTLSPGQYNAVVQDGIETGQVDIISAGYIPSQAGYRAMRQVRLLVEGAGGITDAVETKTAGSGNQGLFDWSAAKAAHTVTITGNMNVGDYNGDGDATYNELGVDYNPSAPLLPEGSGTRGLDPTYPTIDMQWYYDNAATTWPSPSTRIITTTADDASGGSTLVVTSVGFFTGMVGEAVRNVGPGHGTWNSTDWAWIQSVNGNGTQATLDLTINNTWDSDAIRLVKRFAAAPNSGIYYIGGAIAGGTAADTLIDLRDGNITFTDNNLISEGDIVIKGTDTLKMTFSSSGGSGSREHPQLATKDGNIISTEAVSGANKRVISGLIYSENGLVDLNYFSYPTKGASWLRGNMVYGSRITLDGDIYINFISAGVPSTGLTLTPTTVNWREQ